MGLIVAVQMDPIERIDIGGDSTFALLLEAQTRGHTLFYYGPRDLTFREGKVTGRFQPTGLRPQFHEQLESAGFGLPASTFETTVEIH